MTSILYRALFMLWKVDIDVSVENCLKLGKTCTENTAKKEQNRIDTLPS